MSKIAATVAAKTPLAESPLKAVALQQINAQTGNPLQATAASLLQQLPWPARKQETWKYTSVLSVSEQHLTPVAANNPSSDFPNFGTRFHFVNGELSQAPTLPNGIEQVSGRELPELAGVQFFNWLALAQAQPLHLVVKKNQQLEKPLHWIFEHKANQPGSSHQVLILELESGSEASLVENYLGDGHGLNNLAIFVLVGANARFTHYRMQSDSGSNQQINLLNIRQGRDSSVKSVQLMTGNTLRRNDVHVQFLEPGSNLEMHGAYITRGKELLDNHLYVEHMAPHCNSTQVYRGIVGDQSRAVFNGRIHIHPFAKGTDAQLSNKNLLLSNEAEVDSKPELEIYNDDVKCSHGTTVGQMDEKQVFYLRSRGIEETAAKKMLARGFVLEAIAAITDEAVAGFANDWLMSEL